MSNPHFCLSQTQEFPMLFQDSAEQKISYFVWKNIKFHNISFGFAVIKYRKNTKIIMWEISGSAVTGDGIFSINPRFHTTDIERNLWLMEKTSSSTIITEGYLLLIKTLANWQQKMRIDKRYVAHKSRNGWKKHRRIIIWEWHKLNEYRWS